MVALAAGAIRSIRGPALAVALACAGVGIATAAEVKLASPRAAEVSDNARGPSPSEVRRAFEAADLDHDGFISLEEFHKNALVAFNALDTDHDGFISQQELEPLPRALRRSLLGSLRHADTDGDLRLSFKEVMAARMADFAAADADGDGRLSLAEVMNFRSPRPRSP